MPEPVSPVLFPVIKTSETDTVILRLYDNGILHYTYKKGAKITSVEHLKNYHALIDLLGKEKKYPLLVDAGEMTEVTADARKLIRELEPQAPIIARAMVVRRLGEELLTRFYIRINKPFVKMRIFRNYPDAIDWLKQFTHI